jgi:hypothetical protein
MNDGDGGQEKQQELGRTLIGHIEEYHRIYACMKQVKRMEKDIKINIKGGTGGNEESAWIPDTLKNPLHGIVLTFLRDEEKAARNRILKGVERYFSYDGE